MLSLIAVNLQPGSGNQESAHFISGAIKHGNEKWGAHVPRGPKIKVREFRGISLVVVALRV